MGKRKRNPPQRLSTNEVAEQSWNLDEVDVQMENDPDQVAPITTEVTSHGK